MTWKIINPTVLLMASLFWLVMGIASKGEVAIVLIGFSIVFASLARLELKN